MGCSCLSSNSCDLDPIRTFLSFTLLFIAAASSHVDDREGGVDRLCLIFQLIMILRTRVMFEIYTGYLSEYLF